MNVTKDFEEFRNYVSEHGNEIDSAIHQKVDSAMEKENFDELGDRHEFYRRAWVEIGIMEVLELYHNWLSDQD